MAIRSLINIRIQIQAIKEIMIQLKQKVNI